MPKGILLQSKIVRGETEVGIHRRTLHRDWGNSLEEEEKEF